ncbi:MAG: Coq4 family protein [Parvibaculaceae bacterium]
MKRTEEQQEFERLTGRFGQDGIGATDIETLGANAKAGDPAAMREMAAAIAHVAFVSPGASMAVLDNLTRGWVGESAALPGTPPAQLEMLARLGEAERPDAAFWDRFWSFIDNRDGNMSGEEVTARVAGLASNLPASFVGRAEKAAIAHPGTAGAENRALPPKLTLDVLGAQPEGSLGHDFYRLIVDNDFHLEVLDREETGLSDMPPALRYLNTRILQMHDVWHLMAGYRTTALQEVGISAFSLAQFDHSYSGMLIATAATSTLFNAPEAFPVIMQLIIEGWQHGRMTPSFMAIEWEQEWHRPIADIRTQYGIEAFTSIYPADLVEQLRSAAA